MRQTALIATRAAPFHGLPLLAGLASWPPGLPSRVDFWAKMRYVPRMGPRNTLALLLATACQASPMGHTGFGSTPDSASGVDR